MAAVTAELKLEIGKFRRGILAAKAQTRSLAKSAGSMGKRIAGNLFKGTAAAARAFSKAAKLALAAVATAGIAAAGAITVGLKKAFDLGGRLSDVAARIGDSAGNAQILETMFAQAGVSAEKMAPSIQKMQRAIIEARDRGGTLSEPFDELGLSVDALAGMGATQAFDEISKAIGGLEGSAERSARAMQIFGKSGGELLTLFGDSDALKKAQSMVGGQADILSKHANEFDRASDIWGGLSSKVTGLFVGMGESMINHFLPALEALNKIDLAPIGQKLGQSLSSAIDTFRAAWSVLASENIGDIIKTSLVFAFKAAVNSLYKGMIGSVSAAITLLSSPGVWAGMGLALIGVGKTFMGYMQTAIGDLVNALKSKLGKAGKFLGDFGDQSKAVGKFMTASGKEDLSLAGFTSSEGIANAKKSFEKSMEETGNILDNSKAKAELDRLWDAIKEARGNAGKTGAPGAAPAGTNKPVIPQDATGEAVAGLRRGGGPIVQSLAKIGGGGLVAQPAQTAQRVRVQQLTVQQKMLAELKTMGKRADTEHYAIML